MSEMEVGRNSAPWDVLSSGENIRVPIARIEP